MESLNAITEAAAALHATDQQITELTARRVAEKSRLDLLLRGYAGATPTAATAPATPAKKTRAMRGKRVPPPLGYTLNRTRYALNHKKSADCWKEILQQLGQVDPAGFDAAVKAIRLDESWHYESETESSSVTVNGLKLNIAWARPRMKQKLDEITRRMGVDFLLHE